METISTTEVKARKEHKCDYCGLPITVGEIYQRSFIKDCGDVWVWKNHFHCFKISLKLNMFDDCVGDECVTQDSFRDDIQCEYINLTKDFTNPPFLFQFNYVLKYHNIK